MVDIEGCDGQDGGHIAEGVVEAINGVEGRTIGSQTGSTERRASFADETVLGLTYWPRQQIIKRVRESSCLKRIIDTYKPMMRSLHTITILCDEYALPFRYFTQAEWPEARFIRFEWNMEEIINGDGQACPTPQTRINSFLVTRISSNG